MPCGTNAARRRSRSCAGCRTGRRCRVRHGDAAEILNAIALEHRAEQIVVARGSEGGFASRVFGTVAIKLVSSASVPVTVVS